MQSACTCATRSSRMDSAAYYIVYHTLQVRSRAIWAAFLTRKCCVKVGHVSNYIIDAIPRQRMHIREHSRAHQLRTYCSTPGKCVSEEEALHRTQILSDDD